MDTKDETAEKPILLLNLADKLVEAQMELDELTLQLALGKAETMGKYEEVKKEFRYRLVNFKKLFLDRQSDDVFKEIIFRIEQLDDRLNAGNVETREMFMAQRKLIMKKLKTFENEVKTRLPESLEKQHMLHEVESFKLKIEILKLKFELKRFMIKDEIKSNALAIRLRVSILTEKARKRLHACENQLIHLN